MSTTGHALDADYAISVDAVTAWELVYGGRDVLNMPYPIPDEHWPKCEECDGNGGFRTPPSTWTTHFGATEPGSTMEGPCPLCAGSGRGPLELLIHATDEWTGRSDGIAVLPQHTLALSAGEVSPIGPDNETMTECFDRLNKSVLINALVGVVTITSQDRQPCRNCDVMGQVQTTHPVPVGPASTVTFSTPCMVGTLDDKGICIDGWHWVASGARQISPIPHTGKHDGLWTPDQSIIDAEEAQT